jgi:hypothetical protein
MYSMKPLTATLNRFWPGSQPSRTPMRDLSE